MKYQQSNISRRIFFYLILFFLGLMSASVTHAENYTFVTKWGSLGSDNGKFNFIADVAIDSMGDVYIADSNNHRIQKFSSNGKLLTQWGSQGGDNGQFSHPYGVALDSRGNVYVADQGNNHIQKFDSDGKFITRWGSRGSGDGQFIDPMDIAIDSSGNVYVTDSGNYRIQKFDSSGTFITKWGSWGSNSGQLSFPKGIAVDPSGNVYVADTWNHRIQKFDSDGKFLAKWGSQGRENGQFIYPIDIAVDSTGNFYVADTDNNRIQKFDNDGKFLAKWGSQGSDDGQFEAPWGIAVDFTGNVYVADAWNHRIQMFMNSVPIQKGTNLFLSLGAPESKDHGSSMTYKLYFFNFGDSSAYNVVLEDRLPDNLVYSASDGGVYDSSTRTVRWNIGSVNSTGHGYRALNINIPKDVPVGTIIVNNAIINTSDLEVRFDDNKAQAKTVITGLNLPSNIDIQPNNGGIGTPSVYYGEPVTFSYHSSDTATGVELRIHLDDGGPDITDRMTGGPSDWTYTTTFAPRHGCATVTVTVVEGPCKPVTTPPLPSKIRVYITATGKVKEVPFKDYVKGVLPNEWEPSWKMDSLKAGAMAVKTFGWYCILNHNPNFITKDGQQYDVRDNTDSQVYDPKKVSPSTDQAVDETWDEVMTKNGKIFRSEYKRNTQTAGQMSQLGTKKLAEQGKDWKSIVHKYYDPVCIQKTESFNIYIDPAGFIYDIDTGQRIAGASVWLQRLDDSEGWQNVSTGETTPVAQPDINPLISDQNGMYHWDVLEGSYRVHVEVPGYEPKNSIIVSIPPPVTDLHVGLYHIYNPNASPTFPVANFVTNISSGYAPLSVQFTDLSENATGWNWDFGDKTNSTDRYPIHNYFAQGIYTVNLTTSNGYGRNSTTGIITVQIAPIYPVANFSCNITEGYAPLTVQFSDSSKNTIERNWDFGDGFNSTEKNPTHSYREEGNYEVVLTVSNANGTDTNISEVKVQSHTIPDGFNFLIFSMIVLYLWKKSN